MLVNIVLFQITDRFMAEFGISTADLRGEKYFYAQLHTSLFHSKHRYKFQKREQTITSSGSSHSQAQLTAAHGAFSIQVHL